MQNKELPRIFPQKEVAGQVVSVEYDLFESGGSELPYNTKHNCD
jgi:hypothetical protein